MKIVILFKNKYQSKKRLEPRDIRNYIGSITENNPELNKFVMWHERSLSPIIYSMPNPTSAAIFLFDKTSKKSEVFAEEIKKAILANSTLYVNDEIIEIADVRILEHHYTDFNKGYYERELKTPMIIAVSKSEYARARKLSVDKDNIDYNKLEELVIEKITESIMTQTATWQGKENDISGELIVKFRDLKYTPIKYKEGIYFPAVRGAIISNMKLPQFLGYKIGLGYGELLTIKEMKRRENRNR